MLILNSACSAYGNAYSKTSSLCMSILSYTIQASATKPETFFRVEPDFGSKIRFESGQVGPQDRKTGPIRSGWPQIGFKF